MRSTNIPHLDELLGGGIPPGSSVIFCANPGVECEAFGYQTLMGALDEGENGFIFTNVAEPTSVNYEFNRYGWGLKDHIENDQIFFIDGCSYFIGSPINGKYGVEDHLEVHEVVEKAIDDIPGGIGVINNLSTLIDYLGDHKTLKIIKSWNSKAKEKGITLIYIFTKWDYNPLLIEYIKSQMDCVIDLSTIEDRVIIGQGFMVTGTSWDAPNSGLVMFFVNQPGGVKIYKPKVLVTGPYNSGKSSFVNSISKKSISDDIGCFDELPETLNLDLGEIDHDGFAAHLFGTPGQERFDLLLDILAQEAMGAFIVVDASDPDTFARAKEMIKKCKSEAIPKVIIANKQDLKTALSPYKIRDIMKIDGNIPIIPTTATDKESYQDALDALVNLIYGGSS